MLRSPGAKLKMVLLGHEYSRGYRLHIVSMSNCWLEQYRKPNKKVCTEYSLATEGFPFLIFILKVKINMEGFFRFSFEVKIDM